MGKVENAVKQHILHFQQCFLSFVTSNIGVIYILLSVNAFNLVDPKILLLGKGLNCGLPGFLLPSSSDSLSDPRSDMSTIPSLLP